MVGLERIKAVRAFGLGLAAALLSACASMPATVSVVSGSEMNAPPLPYDPYAAPTVLPGRAPLQCVPFAREQSGIQIYGDANTWWAQAAGRYARSNSPAAGSVLVMRGYSDPGRGHVAVVTQVVSSRVILVNHANWLNRGEISVNVPVADVSPNNDWSEVRVWYIPNRQWGSRVYQANGFIHPFFITAAIS